MRHDIPVRKPTHDRLTVSLMVPTAIFSVAYNTKVLAFFNCNLKVFLLIKAFSTCDKHVDYPPKTDASEQYFRAKTVTDRLQ